MRHALGVDIHSFIPIGDPPIAPCPQDTRMTPLAAQLPRKEGRKEVRRLGVTTNSSSHSPQHPCTVSVPNTSFVKLRGELPLTQPIAAVTLCTAFTSPNKPFQPWPRVSLASQRSWSCLCAGVCRWPVPTALRVFLDLTKYLVGTLVRACRSVLSS